MKNILVLIFILNILHETHIQSIHASVIRYIDPSSCNFTHYFDISQLMCIKCPNNSATFNKDCKPN